MITHLQTNPYHNKKLTEHEKAKKEMKVAEAEQDRKKLDQLCTDCDILALRDILSSFKLFKMAEIFESSLIRALGVTALLSVILFICLFA